MNYVSHASCMIYAKIFAKDQLGYVCPDHGTEGLLDFQENYEAVKRTFSKADLGADRDPSIFRYRPLLPVEDDSPASGMVVDNSSLLEFIILGKELGENRLFIKDDGQIVVKAIEVKDPQGSFGAKGVGEIGLVSAAPAAINALSKFDGIKWYELPI